MKYIDFVDEQYFLRTNVARKEPKITPVDIAICCPVCREGSSWEKKQRCHLYIKESFDKPMVHCYNCDLHTNLFNFLSQVDESLAIQYKREKFSDKIQELKKKEDSKIIKRELSLEHPSVFLNVSELPFRKDKKIKEYLAKRNLEEFSDLFLYSYDNIELNGKFLPIKDSIITPLMYGEQMYGFQARKLSTKMFISFLPDENMGFKAWNFYNLDKDKPVFIFESVFDALSSGLPLENITSALGADFSPKLEEQLKFPIYALDNHNKDETAKKKCLNIVKRGGYCVVLPKTIHFKDYNEMLLNGYERQDIKEIIIKNVEQGTKAVVKLSL